MDPVFPELPEFLKILKAPQPARVCDRIIFYTGKELHQCVYGAKYYDKPDIICLCVRVGGVRTETVEVFLKDRRIGQCRGIHNQNSKRHDEILALATKTMNKFINAVPARGRKPQQAV